MKPLLARNALAIGAGLLVLAAPGCGKKLHSLLEPAPAPAASLRAVRLPGASADSAAFELTWSANAPGRRIDHYRIAIDPHSLDGSDPAWQATRDTRRVFGFAARPTRGGPASPAAVTTDRHVFALRAVDAAGEESPPVGRTLALTNIPPTVQIISPVPNPLLYQIVTPSAKITWTGDDPDGQISRQPVQYKYKLLNEHGTEFPFDLALSNPDSLRRFYAPGFPGWDAVPGTTTSVQFLNLVTNDRYLFVLVAIDEAGDYSPVFSLSTNMLQMRVSLAGAVGPVITMYNEYFNYTYASGGYYVDPTRVVNVQVAGGIPLTFNWSAKPFPGVLMRSYRWSVDIADLSDQTPRINEQTDWAHWSSPSLEATSATIGPFPPLGTGRQTHVLYIEAMDSNGLVSLGMVRFMVAPRIFSDEHSLLIVDDTRRFVDHLLVPADPAHPDSMQRPFGPWPSAAELDTFLFARGGMRHRMTPDGTLSLPGIFAGYHFDTVSTRFIPGGTMPLALLSLYRHVVWVTDSSAAYPPLDLFGGSLLRQMCNPGRENTLAAYLKQGGQLWLVGGAAGSASTLPWNNLQNDAEPPVGVLKFSSTPLGGHLPELQIGRFMYDFAHWRSGFYAFFSEARPAIYRATWAAGGWPGAPNYALLPAQLGPKTIGDDPTPPLRTVSNFFGAAAIHQVEYLSEPNSILRDLDPDPAIDDFASMLDTLFVAQGVIVPPSAPRPYIPACMTYYHGPDSGGMLFSGFDLWTFTRPDLITLTDFVLQQVWGLPRDPVPRSISSPPPLAGRPRGL